MREAHRLGSPLAALASLTAVGCAPEFAGPIVYPDPAQHAAAQISRDVSPDEDTRAIAQATVAVTPLAPPRAWDRVRLSAASFTTADAIAPTTGPVLEAGVLGHDPQLAVSDRFLFVYSSHRYQIHDKATGAIIEGNGTIAPIGDFTTSIFGDLWAPRDASGRPNPANINVRLRFAATDPVTCDTEAPTQSNACVQEFYDTRVLWDEQRRRFWIESAVRNHLWKCKPGDTCDIAKKQSPTQARRYIAVAVSRTEDPRQGFHRYILVDEYADWPKIGVHDRYLLLAHRSSKWLYVFDADKLAAGNPDGGPVRVAKIDVSRVPGVKFVAPVSHHGPSDGFTYLLGTSNTTGVVPFALVNPDPNRAAPPVIYIGPRIDVGERLNTLENNAVWRNGILHFTWDMWAPGHERDYRQVNVVRLPVRSAPGTNKLLWSTVNPAEGFLRTVIGNREPDDPSTDVIDYEKPALDVNAAGDAVIVYSRRGYKTAADLAPEVRYSILRHDETKARAGVLLKRGTWMKVPDINDNAKAGIDLAYAQVDPTDDRSVWVTHAYADAQAKWYRQIVAAVKP